MRNMMNTITLITIRNTPQTISLMMYQRILTIQRKQRNRNANTASPMAYKECPQYVGEVKPPSLQWYRTFEIGIAVYLFGYPILFLSVQHLAIVHFHTKSVNLTLM